MKTKLTKEEEKIEKAQDKGGMFIASEEEKKILNRVYDRFTFMKNSEARIDYEEDANYADEDYNGVPEITLDEDDYRSNINKPISFAVIETIMQESIERKPRPYTDPRSFSDTNSSMFTNDVLKFSFDIGNFDFQHALAKKESLKYGTGFLFEYYRYDVRTVEMMDLKKNKDGEIEESYKKEEKVDYDDVYAEYIPGRWLYFDPSANHISKCRDMVKREIMNIDEFKRVYGSKRGFTNTDLVNGSGDTSWPDTYTPHEGMDEDQVEIIHYYNRSIDRYDVVANGVVVRKGPNPYPHKELPVIVLYAYKDPSKFYGIGISKIIKSLKEERNTQANLRMEAAKMGLSKMFLYDDMIELEDIDLIPRPHGGIPVNTNGRPINQVIQWLDYSNIPLSSYKEEEVLIEDIRRTTGVDDRIQGLNMGGTATEASILKEATMRRINAQNIMNEMDGLTRLGELRLANIKFFYSIPKFEKIMGNDDNEKIKESYRNISVKGKQYTIDESGGLVVEETEGTHGISLNKKMMKFIEKDYDIVVKADSSYAISKPVYQSKMMELVDRITANPLLQGQVDGRKLAKLLSRINEVDPREWMKDSMEDNDARFLAQQENDVMTAGYPLPPTKNATEVHTMVHINYAESAEASQIDPVIQQIIESHIRGEGMSQGVLQGGAPAPDMASQLPNPGMSMQDVNPNGAM